MDRLCFLGNKRLMSTEAISGEVTDDNSSVTCLTGTSQPTKDSNAGMNDAASAVPREEDCITIN